MAPSSGEQKGARKPPNPVPPFSLAEALKIAEAITDKNAGRPFDRLLVADAIGIKPNSSNFRDLLKASYQYGLTLGSEKSAHISLTELGQKITKPVSDAERSAALAQAALKPELAVKVYRHYDRGKFPAGNFFTSALERQFGVAPEWSKPVAKLLEGNARFVGAIRLISGSEMVMLDSIGKDGGRAEIDAAPDNGQLAAEIEGPAVEREQAPQTTSVPASPPAPSAIFIGHGRNKAPLNQVKAILDQLKIPYRIAIYEPNKGLPIPAKVAGVMRECSSAILIFTRDECLYNKDGEEVWLPGDNVVHELGAASALYGGKIIIFKEKGVTLATNFASIGYIEFEADSLAAKTMELLKELIAFDLVSITPKATSAGA